MDDNSFTNYYYYYYFSYTTHTKYKQNIKKVCTYLKWT